ncbi:MAG: hypothetical protein AB7G11_01515 [Phycisphaerales bacterium]
MNSLCRSAAGIHIGAMMLGLLAASCPSLAQSDPAGPEPTTPVLAGPKVKQSAARPTLVEYDFPGKVKRLDTAPEAAAAALLSLSSAVRAKVDEILNDRIRNLDDFVSENLLLLNQLDTAGKAGDKLDQLKVIAQAVHKLAPVWSKGSLKRQIRDALPAEAQAEFDRLIEEYWSAIVKERQDLQRSQNRVSEPDAMSEPGAQAQRPPGPRPAERQRVKSRFEIVTEERLASFGKEIERAFQRQVSSGDIIADYIFRYIQVSDDQKASIRLLCNQHAQKTKMNASEQQNRELLVKIAGVLDTKQQTQLARLLRGLKKGKP